MTWLTFLQKKIVGIKQIFLKKLEIKIILQLRELIEIYPWKSYLYLFQIVF